MKFLRCHGGAAWGGAVLAGLLASTGTPAHATRYDESLGGDLSSDAGNPTPIGALTPGTNAIAGATIPSGPVVDPQTGARAVEDNDYVSFTVPVGRVLARIVIGDGSVFQGGDRMFFGIARGIGVDVDPSFSSAAGLLGWTLVGSRRSAPTSLRRSAGRPRRISRRSTAPPASPGRWAPAPTRSGWSTATGPSTTPSI